MQPDRKISAGDEFIPTRLILLSRLKRWDDQERWRDFFDTYWKFLYSIAIKAGLSDPDARDMVQETVVAVAKGLREGRFKAAEGSPFKAWLQLIVQRRVASHLRRRRLPFAEAAPGGEDTSRTPLVEKIPAPEVIHDYLGRASHTLWLDVPLCGRQPLPIRRAAPSRPVQKPD